MRFASAVGLLCIGLAHYDATPTVSYVLQDDNYNVVALTNTSGVITRQHAFDPYGSLIARDDFPAFGQTAAPKTRLGHQGLTVDRLDAPWDVDLVVAGTSTGHPAGSTASPDAAPRLITLNRNRTYDPLFARFHQRDPNETALPLIGLPLSSGVPVAVPLQALEMRDAYRAGMNQFEYVGSDPVNGIDPLGLESKLLITRDWDDIWDSIVGNGHAFLGAQGAATFGAFWGGNVAMLPDGALAAAGLSQGFSEFADFYAEQVIYLPVDGALAGLGAYARIAAVGSKAGEAGRFARLASQGGHHPIPKFLGGFNFQYLVKLPKHIHEEFHNILRGMLRNGGFAENMLWGGRNGSTEAWRVLFGGNIGMQRRAFEAILDASRYIDGKYGTDLVGAFWRNVMENRFFYFM